MSKTYSEAVSCDNCICNSSPAEWAFYLKDGKALPMTPKLLIAPYSTFSRAAREQITPNYAKEVLRYIS